MRATLVGVAAVLALAACSGPDPVAQEPSPTPEVSASPLDTPSASASSSSDASASPSPSVSESEDPTGPSDTDRARFVQSYRPDGAGDLEHVQVDVDGDGVDELVFAYVRGPEGVGHVDVADWDPEAASYTILTGADGGVADRVERVRIGDLNADGRVEVALFQANGSSGQSMTMWAVDGDRLVPLRARGGCWDGQATYGVVGVELRDSDGDGIPEVHATCDDSPLPVTAWSTDAYRWQSNSWTHDPNL